VSVVLTGATGFLGLQVLDRALADGERPVTALVRARDDADATRRVREALASLGDEPSARAHAVTALAADLTAPGLGLSRDRWRQLAEEAELIVHSGANVAFDQPLDQARRVNVGGTELVLALARQAHEAGTLRRLVTVSTAYVAGEHEGTFGEDDLDLGQTFRNSYERSKFEAERFLRANADGIPLSVLRPSIVVGERQSGWTTAFNVLYWPLRAFARGLLSAVPAESGTLIDAVPIDVVADAVWAIGVRPGPRRETLNLVAGERATTVDELAELAAIAFDRPRAELVSLTEFVARAARGEGVSKALIEGPAAEQASQYLPYFGMRVSFDDRGARHRLDAGLRAPEMKAYFDQLVAYAGASRWGKRRVSRQEARNMGFERMVEAVGATA
jgi:thioester reductase-like protein